MRKRFELIGSRLLAIAVVGVIALTPMGVEAQNAVPVPQAPPPGPLKIGFIRSQEILAQAPGRAEAEAQFEKEMGAFRTQLTSMEDSLRTLMDAFEKEAAKLDSSTRETRGKAVQAREEDYQKRAQQLNMQMQQRQNELIRPILEQVNKTLEEIRAAEQFSFIFDVTAQGSPIVAADKGLDLTDKVIARLKAAGPPKPVAAPTGSPLQKPAGVTRPRN